MGWPANQIKLFRTLLYCYPAEFRHEYGAEMEHVFASRLQSEPRWRLWLELISDVAFSAPREHWHVLVSDVKYGVRSLVGSPGFTAVALLVIAIGIGATTAVFSLVNAVLLRSLPYGHPQRLVYLWEPNTNFKGVPQELGPSVPDIYEWEHTSRSFSSITAFMQQAVNVSHGGSAERFGAAFVDRNFFRTFEAAPEVGRTLDANDDQPGHEHVAVISYEFRRSQFGAAPDVIGRQIVLNRQSYTIVGVMPKDFGYPFDGDVPYDRSGFKQADLWLPAAYTAKQKSDRVNFANALAVGRLKAGVSVAAAQAELKAIETRLQPLYPEMWRGWTVFVKSLVQTIVGPVESLLWLLLGAVAVVLLIATSNFASLLLARATRRAHELGIRAALGAERARLIRQLLTESLLISVAGAIMGVLVSYGAVHVLTRMNPGNIPRFETAQVDGRALFVALALALATGFAAGIGPALSASRANVMDLLRTGGTRVSSGSTRARAALIVLEVALSMILLTGACLLIRSYLAVEKVDPGFSTSTLTFQLGLDDRYQQPDQQAALQKNLLAKLRVLPGIAFVGASNTTPLSNDESMSGAEIRGFGHTPEMIEARSITPDYRHALGTPLLRGRDIVPSDIQSKAPVALINRRFAELYLKGRDPLGAQIRTGIGDLSKTPWSTIVGMIGDIRSGSIEDVGLPAILQPADAGDHFALSYTGTAQQTASKIRASLASIDRNVTLENVHTLRERITASNARRRFQTTLLTSFAIIAVLLVLAGLYGLMSYTVKQRTPEIAIRLAVGSPRRSVLQLILWQGLRLTVFGLVLGLGISFALTRLISAWLFGVKATDPFTFLLTPLLILAVTAAATLIPAWSATRIDPADALKAQ